MRHDPDSGTTKRLLRRVVSTQDRKRPQDLIPKGDASAWPVPRDGTTSVSAGHGAGWWAWLDLNQRPHPDRKTDRLGMVWPCFHARTTSPRDTSTDPKIHGEWACGGVREIRIRSAWRCGLVGRVGGRPRGGPCSRGRP